MLKSILMGGTLGTFSPMKCSVNFFKNLVYSLSYTALTMVAGAHPPGFIAK